MTPAVLDVTDADSLLDAIALASAAEVTPNRWLINGDDFIALRKLKDEANGGAVLAGVRCHPRRHLPAVRHSGHGDQQAGPGTAVLADMSQVAVARDLAPSITVLTERYAEYDQIGIRVTTRYDLGLLHPEAVIVLSAEGSS